MVCGPVLTAPCCALEFYSTVLRELRCESVLTELDRGLVFEEL